MYTKWMSVHTELGGRYGVRGAGVASTMPKGAALFQPCIHRLLQENALPQVVVQTTTVLGQGV